jgi:aminoglycoside phosphotransferase (APT) family kinase protein
MSAAEGGRPRLDDVVAHLEQSTGWRFEVLGPAPGNSHDGWVLARLDSPGAKMLARIEPAQGPFLRYDGVSEAALLRRLAELGFPVPNVISVGGPDVLGAGFMVTEWIDGDVHTPRSAAQLDKIVRVGMATELATMLARLHALQADEFRGLPEDREASTDAEFYFDQFDATLDALEGVECLVLDYARAWLARQLPHMRMQSTLVHGDFRLANVVWRDQKIAGVLDWETARLGNPLFDLGWICMGARSEEDSIMGLVPRREFVKLYTDASGRSVADHELIFWQVAAAWVRGCTELRLLDLAQRCEDLGTVDARDLSWQFGAYRTDYELLSLIEAFDHCEVRRAGK